MTTLEQIKQIINKGFDQDQLHISRHNGIADLIRDHFKGKKITIAIPTVFYLRILFKREA